MHIKVEEKEEQQAIFHENINPTDAMASQEAVHATEDFKNGSDDLVAQVLLILHLLLDLSNQLKHRVFPTTSAQSFPLPLLRATAHDATRAPKWPTAELRQDIIATRKGLFTLLIVQPRERIIQHASGICCADERDTACDASLGALFVEGLRGDGRRSGPPHPSSPS